MNIIAIGTDLVECERVDKVMTRHAERFVERVLTDVERAYVAEKVDPVPHVAGRFAAKEAILKVLGTGWRGQIAWTDMEIVNDGYGQPHVTLSGACREVAARRGIERIMISISHTPKYAMAMAMGVGAGV